MLPVSPTSSHTWLAHLTHIVTCLPSLCWVCLLSLILLVLAWCQLFKVKVEGRGFCLEWPEGSLPAGTAKIQNYTHKHSLFLPCPWCKWHSGWFENQRETLLCFCCLGERPYLGTVQDGAEADRLVGFGRENKYWQNRKTLPYVQGCMPSGSFPSSEELGLGCIRELGMALVPPSSAQTV